MAVKPAYVNSDVSTLYRRKHCRALTILVNLYSRNHGNSLIDFHENWLTNKLLRANYCFQNGMKYEFNNLLSLYYSFISLYTAPICPTLKCRACPPGQVQVKDVRGCQTCQCKCR